MDLLGYVVQALGSAVNGVLQVITDFINLIIGILPNPDPFPAIIEGLDVGNVSGAGMAYYWLDAAVGVEFAVGVIGSWAALMVASSVFAVVYWVIKSVKP